MKMCRANLLVSAIFYYRVPIIEHFIVMDCHLRKRGFLTFIALRSRQSAHYLKLAASCQECKRFCARPVDADQAAITFHD